MPKLWLEVRITGAFQSVDEEREYIRFIQNRVEKQTEKYFDDNDMTARVRVEAVTGDKMEPDDDKDRIRKRGLRDAR